VIFISENLHSLIPILSSFVWGIILIPVFSLLVNIRALKYLAPFSFIANFTILIGIGVVFAYAIPQMSLDHVHGIEPRTLPVFFGMAVYCYEGIGVVIPIESSMKRPTMMLPVLYSVMGIISCLLISFGSIGYLGYGSATQSIITGNLPDNTWTLIIKLLLCFTLMVSFPIQMYPVIELFDKQIKNDKKWLWSTLMRTGLAIFASFVGLSLPHFGLFIGLIGAFGSSTLAFILPCAFHLKLFKLEATISVMILDWAILIFGLVGGIIGTVITIQQLVEAI